MDLLEKLANATNTDSLTKLARAFDTKGYPDDKNPDHWRTINHAPTHIDGNGKVDGGAGGKFTGNAWTSEKYPHKPESYEGYKKPEPAPPPEPKPTKEDLLSAWKKVVKYQVAMKQGKSEATWNKHASNMKNAISEYEALKAKADPDVQGSHNPKLDLAKQFSDLQYGQFVAAKHNTQPEPSQAAPSQDPLQAFAQATTSPTTSGSVGVDEYIQKANELNDAVYNCANADDAWEADKYADEAKKLLKTVSAENYDKFSLEEKKKIWKAFGSKAAYMSIIETAGYVISSDPLEDFANATTKQGMEAFPNGLKSAGIGKQYKPVTMAKIKAAQKKSSASKDAKQATYQKLGAESAKAWAKGTALEKKCAYEYTASYSKYNEPLRGQEYYGSYKGVGKVDFDHVYQNPDQRKKTDALTSLINKTSLGEPQMVYRGCDYKGMDKALNVPLSLLQSGDINKIRAALEGMEWTDHGFGSVGANNGSGFSGDIKMEIYAPKGTKGIYAEAFSAYGQDYGHNWDGELKPGYTPGHENEIILQRGTRYKIMAVEKNGSGIKLVMQIISQDPYKLP